MSDTMSPKASSTTTSNATADPGEEPIVWNAKLLHIYISPGHDYWTPKGEGRLMHGIQSPREVRAVEDMGLEGDRYFGEKPGGKAQVTFIQADVLDEVRQKFKLPKLPAGVLRRNLVVEGVQLADFMGKTFEFQGVLFEGSQQCSPCQWMDRVIAEGAQAFLKGDFRGGLRAKVKSTGVLRVDD